MKIQQGGGDDDTGDDANGDGNGYDSYIIEFLEDFRHFMPV